MTTINLNETKKQELNTRRAMARLRGIVEAALVTVEYAQNEWAEAELIVNDDFSDKTNQLFDEALAALSALVDGLSRRP